MLLSPRGSGRQSLPSVNPRIAVEPVRLSHNLLNPKAVGRRSEQNMHETWRHDLRGMNCGKMPADPSRIMQETNKLRYPMTRPQSASPISKNSMLCSMLSVGKLQRGHGAVHGALECYKIPFWLRGEWRHLFESLLHYDTKRAIRKQGGDIVLYTRRAQAQATGNI